MSDNQSPPEHRSVSQVKQWEQCPHSYYLARIVKAWERPAAWLDHGKADHAAIEAWEKSGRTMTREQAHDVFREEYAKGINALCADTPNFNFWFSSGKYRGEADVERRYGIGLEMVDRYIAYAEKASHEAIWITPDGTPAIELGLDVDLDGVRVKGFIDQVITTGDDGELRVRDVKTGASPGETFQLKTYAVMIEETYKVPVHVGDYWMGKTGKPTKHPYDLTEMTRSEVVDRFHAADEGIRAENWEPKPDPDVCRRCPVATACAFSA